MKELFMLIFTAIIAGFGQFMISIVMMIYSGATAVSNSSMVNKVEFSLLHRIWILACIGFLSLIPIIIFTWSPLDETEQWARLGAFIGFVFVEIKSKSIITLSRYFINGYYTPLA